MGSTTTSTTIANRALQLLGYQRIGSLNDNNRGAVAINRAYLPRLESMLRSNYWGFSIMRVQLAALATKPAFGKSNYFALPGDWLCLAPPDQYTSYGGGALPVGPIPTSPNTGMQYIDFQFENFQGTQVIASDLPAPLALRYVSSNVTEAMFDPCFAEAFSADLAMETCEELTQSNTKITNAEKAYDNAMELAKKRNAYEKMPTNPPIDPWILARI